MKSVSARAHLNPDCKLVQPLPLLPGRPAATNGAASQSDSLDWLKFQAGTKPQPGAALLPVATPPFPARVWRLF